MKFLMKLFSPPVFEDETETEKAYLLHVILWTLVFVPIPFVLYTLIAERENIARALIQTAFGETVNIILLVVLRKGFVRSASIVQVSAFWFFFTATAVTGSGVQSEAYLLGYAVVIAIAGLLLGGRGALIFTVLSILSGWAMVQEQARGVIHSGFESSPLTTWIISTILFPVSAILQYLGSRGMRNSLVRLRASEEQMRNIIENAEEIIYTFNARGDFLFISPAWTRLLGHSVADVAGKNLTQFVHPADLRTGVRALRALIKTGLPQQGIEYRVRHKHGNWRWHTSTIAAVKDELREAKYYVGIAQDTTERKQSEEALRRSESIYRRAIEVAGAVPYHQTFDAQGRILYDFMGEGIRQITGYGPEEFNDDLWDSLVIERNLLGELEPYSLDEAIRQVRTGVVPVWKCEHRIRARDGTIRWVFEAAVDLRDERDIAIGSVGLYQDITERKQSEEVLKYERDLLQIFMDNIPDTVYFKDAESRFVRVNTAQARFLNLANPQDAIGKSDLDFQPHDLAQQFMDEEKRIIETGEPIINRIEFNPTADGKPRWLSATKVPIKDPAGNPIGTIGISRDVTAQRLAEKLEEVRRTTLEKVLRLGQYVTEVQDVSVTLQRIWHSVRHQLGFDRLGIYLYETGTHSMTGTYGTDIQGKMVDEWDVHINLAIETIETISFRTALKEPNGLYITHDYEGEHNIPPHGHIMSGVKDYGAVSAWAGDKPVAVLCVDNLVSGRNITEEQLEALRLFAGYAGLAIENARLHSALAAELEQQKQAEEREVRRRIMLEKVVKLGKHVTEVADLRTTLERIWHGVHDDLGFDRLGIFLYNAERNSMDDTFGTTDKGEMIEEWDIWFPVTEAATFMRVLERPDGLYFTHNYDVENDIGEESEMFGVKDFAAVAVWAGDKPVAVICVDHLITKRLISEEQLESLRLFAGYAGLAIENARLNTALEDDLNHRKMLIKELENKNAELERFTYTVSHDLKSPLVTITGFLGFLERDALAGNAEQVRRGINRINNAAHKMQALLNDLLELSRIGRIMNPPEDISFTEIVHEAVDHLRGRLDEINAIVEIQRDLPIVRGDHVRLVEVVQNLIENAAKYSAPNRRPRIELGMEETAFFVRDNGIGIAPEYHDNIFGLFNKLDANAEGTGIGLTLVKRIIEVHGGKIWVESESGRGATFYFTLPFQHTKE
jgi:PAS domain S-box-containing protein